MEDGKKLNILILEDVRDDAVMIERVLRKGGISFVAKQVDTRDEFIEGLEEFHPDVVLSDHSLPQFNSAEAYKICVDRKLPIPFILVTGTVSEEYAVTCLKQGIDDYVLKTNLSRLPSAILSAIKQKRLEHLRKVTMRTLRKQNDSIVKINKELDSFVYSVSHNLRAPLASIKGLLDIAKYDYESKNNFEIVELHTMIESSICKLDLTLRQILDYSRNARLDISPEPIDVAKLINECFENLGYMGHVSDIHQEVSISNLIPFYSDKYRLTVIFNSILSNAVKYRDNAKEESTITIQATVTDKNVSIKFEDNGIGINEELLPKVYDMFFRANERSNGAGLGLYIAKEIVEKLKGEIQISSVEFEGTTVTLLLPNLQTSEQEPSTVLNNHHHHNHNHENRMVRH